MKENDNNDSEVVLSVRNLKTCLKLKGSLYPVVNGISFDLKKGKTLAILGESGCGKSMTAFSLIKVLPKPPAQEPTGKVLFEGKNLLSLTDKELRKIRGKKIGMIFQNPMTALNPVFTIGDQIMEVVNLHLNLYNQEAFNKIIEMLKEVGIPEPEKRFFEYPHQLSGGMQQRVMIAMALICEPDILIADEPTTALDVTVQKQVLYLMKELQRKKGTAILLITHDMGVVAEVADDIVVMYASYAMEKGSIQSVFKHMAHPYTQGLFNSLPKKNTARGALSAIEGIVPDLDQISTGCPFFPRCKKALEKCKTTPLKTFNAYGEKEHQVQCFLHEESQSV
ncbi:Dipeptide transport ATP-binding protein DppD [Chlamydiales bacterium SCGC AB-751-O23]|jgi:oligopeptide/dipeptide ABC transporter ATP-binding protein|nr:Dipeptide transport ATP-binding protein DppD [Chlamydiales bacterium SCGC AB-751-O23]